MSPWQSAPLENQDKVVLLPAPPLVLADTRDRNPSQVGEQPSVDSVRLPGLGSPSIDGDARIGLWLNKSLVKALELPFPHEVSDGGQPETWLLTVQGDGKATARFVDGEVQGIDMREGDFILASGQAIYVSRSLEGADAGGNIRREARAGKAAQPRKRTSGRTSRPRKES